MPSSIHSRYLQHLFRVPLGRHIARCIATAATMALPIVTVHAQTDPAKASAPAPDKTAPHPAPPVISAKHMREADDAYIAGARLLAANNISAAEQSFARAVQLDPSKSEYALSLAVAKEHHITALVQQAAKARLLGHNEQADRLFAEAHTLDPDNEIVREHLDPGPISRVESAPTPVGFDDISKLAGPIQLKPSTEVHSFHSRGEAQDILREVYTAYGIKPTFDSGMANQTLRFDLDNADFATASRILLMMARVFVVPLDEKSVLVAKDSQENRDRLVPQIEETILLPGFPIEQLNELSNVAKGVFDIKQVTVSAAAGELILRGNEDALKLVNATFANMLDGGAEVMLELHLYEVDKNYMRNIGANLPTSAGVFSIASEATTLVNANQTLLQQAISSGLLVLDGTPLQNLIKELEFLVGSGAVNVAQVSGFLGTFGGGLTLAGLFLGSGSSFNLLLNTSDVRSLDHVQLRAGDHQTSVFRSGTRYPITTATYSSAVSSSLASALSGVKIGGTNVSNLLNQYANAAASTVPQVQFEDLGLTLKASPQVLKSNQVFVHLDMKIEALAGGQINSIPILNSRQLTSDITIPEGQTALLASVVTTQEMHTIEGLPGLSEIPGFQGTEKNVEKDSVELLITLTPHIIRRRSPITASRRLIANTSLEPQ